MSIAPCRICGSMPYEQEFSDCVAQECYGANCGVRGPRADTREKSIAGWNTLMGDPLGRREGRIEAFQEVLAVAKGIQHQAEVEELGRLIIEVRERQLAAFGVERTS